MICDFEGCESKLGNRNKSGSCKEHNFCSIEGCSNPRNAHGMCVGHENRVNKGWPLKTETLVCRAEDCNSLLRIDNDNEYCSRHVWRSDQYKANKKRLRDEKYSVVNQIKMDSGCVDCGYNKNALALQFDHVGDNKIANVSRMIGDNLSLERILGEIAKCEVVCANDHAIRTGERRDAQNGN